MADISNTVDRHAYSDPAIVAVYSRSNELQPAEQALFDRLGATLKDMDVLDMGVGAGRTAFHLAHAARSYLGVDYAAPMIDACRLRLPGVHFEVGNACAMDFAADQSFDLVLFAYNGIDHLSERGRTEFLREALRVLRPGGLLFFSSHNINFIPAIIERFRFRIKESLRETLRSLKWATIFRLRNLPMRWRLGVRSCRFNDGLHGFTCGALRYIRADQQVEDLAQLGMEEIECAGHVQRVFLPGNDPTVPSIDDPWIYYVCRKPRG